MGPKNNEGLAVKCGKVMSYTHNQYCSFTVDPNLTRRAFGRGKSWSTGLDDVEIGLDKAVGLMWAEPMFLTRDQIEHDAYNRWIRRDSRCMDMTGHDWLAAENELLTFLLPERIDRGRVPPSPAAPFISGVPISRGDAASA